MDQRVQAATDFIEANLSRRLTITDIATAAHVSARHLRRLFNSEQGMSPMQYVRNARMQRTRELLETASLSIKEIAAKVGANDVSHFVREFEKASGASPATYRARFAVRRSGTKRRS